MRLFPKSALLIASAFLAACGGGGPGELDPGVAPEKGLYVDAVNGSDTNPGTSSRPFKSIKRGLTAAAFGETVHVLPGTYDVANGEHFPILPGIGVTIVGTERDFGFGKQRLSHVVGGGFWSGDIEGRLHATIVPSLNNRIVGLAIHNPQPFVIGGAKPAPVVLASSGATVESCLLHDSDKGVRIVNGVRFSLITDCDFIRNGIGIFVDGAGSDNRVERCRVTENGVGVMCFTHGVDFGGGAYFSTGNNAFAGNGARDFVHAAGPGRIYALNNAWDHAPPTFFPGVQDGDVWARDDAVITEPSSVYVPPFPFSGTPPSAIDE